MRLSTIKLAGFKSFVDPTTLHLPSNMTGVVGPNGCGKSNIIDAVRWVMGESSASRLRGDSLTDVIFSGSSVRKPVGQATVELIFDNSDGTIAGEFAQYGEISVKRLVSRDGVSAYYLNGGRCRRRDITDLFLGTGLGPRSYSIIEQGMISQIIEARPEDLRVYLEEAAGISKYKERRRETETRIRHTRENLERLKDVREEVQKQLEHLKRQARQAEQYQALRAEQREKDAQLKGMELRGVDVDLVALREQLTDESLRLEALIAQQREAEAQIELCRSQGTEAGEKLQAVQAESYRVGADIARVEQQIQHQRELLVRQQRSLAETESSQAEVATHVAEDQARLDQLIEELAATEPLSEQLAEDVDARAQALHEAEQALVAWQQDWDSHRHAQSEATRAAEVERTRIDYLDRQALESSRRREALSGERAGIDPQVLEETLSAQVEQHEQHRAEVDRFGDLLDARKQAMAEIADQQREQQAALAELRRQLQTQQGRLGSLEALQQAALGEEQGAATDWLRNQGLSGRARVGSALRVESGWETAVETVLGSLIEGVLVDDVAALAESTGSFDHGRLALFDSTAGEGDFSPGTLARLTTGPLAVRRLLSGVHVAADLVEARAKLAGLRADESVITDDGSWLGHGWLRLLRSAEAQQGALLREREIEAVRDSIEALLQREAAEVAALAALADRLKEAESQRDDAQRSLYLAHRAAAELGGELQSLRGKLESARVRAAQIDTELAQIAASAADAQGQTREARGALEQALSRMGELEVERQRLDAQRASLDQQREQARAASRELGERRHQIALQTEARRSQRAALEQSLARMRTQHEQLAARHAEISAQLAEGDAPVQALKRDLQAFLDQRSLVDRDLGAARSAVDGIEAELRRYDGIRQQSEQGATRLREQINQRRLQEQAFDLRATALREAIAAAEFELDALLESLPETADPEAWRRTLVELEVKIRRLEPVNLAAIQEYGELAQRKEYLDSQDADLAQALETLEGAIRKIDRETRGRFKDTFDRVNSGLQELYPRLIGGGHAYLELTGEDLLDTGVAIMARPPGKRVSSITLLSGGEKALTAVALVFAIFRLNPAPFCLLDEVDAPLDEANVGRFCAMVTDMSEKVQFLFVTHNKATMEAARQLAGVTMREPGVSRLVSVDLDEASRLVGVA